MEKPELTDPELEAHLRWEPTENLQGEIVAETED